MVVDAKQVKSQLKGLDPAEIQEWVNIAIEFLVEVTSQRGMTGDELRARRKQIFAQENAVIQAELDSLPGEG